MDRPTAESLLAFAEQTSSDLDGLDRSVVFAALEGRHDELLAAIQWFVDQQRTDDALRTARALAGFWTASGKLEEGSKWLTRALALPGGTDGHRATASFEAGIIDFWLGADERARALHTEALTIGRQMRDGNIVALALTGLARLALRSDDVEQARTLCREALEASQSTADPTGRANALHVLGVAAQMAGDLDEARTFMNERMDLARRMGKFGGLAVEAANLAMVEHQLGHIDRAHSLARESLEIAVRREDEWMFPYLLSRLAAVATARDQLTLGATLIGAAEKMMSTQGTAWPPDERPHYEQTVTTLKAGLGAKDFETASDRGRALSTKEAVRQALVTS